MFKAGVEPKWEDPECANGGKWTFVVTSNRKPALDKAWLETVLIFYLSSFFFNSLDNFASGNDMFYLPVDGSCRRAI